MSLLQKVIIKSRIQVFFMMVTPQKNLPKKNAHRGSIYKLWNDDTKVEQIADITPLVYGTDDEHSSEEEPQSRLSIHSMQHSSESQDSHGISFRGVTRSTPLRQ